MHVQRLVHSDGTGSSGNGKHSGQTKRVLEGRGTAVLVRRVNVRAEVVCRHVGVVLAHTDEAARLHFRNQRDATDFRVALYNEY